MEMKLAKRCEINKTIVAALAEIGIESEERTSAKGFLEDVRIENGKLLYLKDARPANLLHEAGHLACIPPRFRKLANDDLDELAIVMCDYADERIAKTGDPEEPILRAIMQCSDPEATAWAWAFGKHLGLDPETIIESQDYNGTGDIVRLQVSTGMYVGVNGLRAAGFLQSTRDWPEMEKWLQDAEEKEA